MIGSSSVGRRDPGARRAPLGAGRLAHVTELPECHQSADEQHQGGERGEQDGVGHVGRGLRAGGGAADRDDAEGDAAAEHHVACPVRGHRTDSEVTPTTTREPVVACAASWPSR